MSILKPLRKLITTPIVYGLNRMGYHVVPYAPPSVFPRGFDQKAVEDILDAKKYTMTPVERLVALCQAVEYVVENRIPGDIVECGVWRGGSMMVIAKTLMRLGDTQRHLYLFDTFAGMSQPTDADITWDKKQAQDMWEANRNPDQTNNFCFAPLEDVQAALYSTGYDREKIHFVKGKVEDTLPQQAPAVISLLRLDTDWYESTRHELQHLFSRVSRGGAVIFDDYGCWEGAKKAIDEFLKTQSLPLYLHRIDEEARIVIKP